ncbi:MAG: 50S ribosomal protein L13 [Clostridia bacterium]|nr:50S ribosomal protein L13 [Clostridia bacterium]
MKTYIHNPANKSTKWYIVDATDMPLGRLASQVASILRGKNKPEFTPSVDAGDHVIVINSDKVVLTGKKAEQKFYRYHTLYVGGLKEVQYSDMLKNKSDQTVTLAVKGMLPKNRIGRQMIKKLRVYKDANHGHEAQKPELITLAGKR